MQKNHKFFSNLALNLAEKHLGQTNINPTVGCIIEKNNSVISAGLTSISGRPHAEFNALNKKLNFKGSNMYVTLEPCAHYGLTPPCTNIIQNKKIKNVYYIYDDPNPITAGKAKKIFSKKKIKFKKIKIKNNNFYKSYFLNINKKFPLLDAKIAISKDYNSINKKTRKITNKRSHIVTHLLRSKYDSILSTSKTINKDNALLNCRIDGLNNFKPDLLIIDRFLKLKKKLELFDLTKKRKTYIFTESNNKKKISFFKKKHCKIVKIKKLENKDDFLILLDTLYKLGKRRVLVETGLIFLNKVLKFKIINELFIFKTNSKLKRDGYNNTSSNFLKKFKLKKSENVNLVDNKLFKVKV